MPERFVVDDPEWVERQRAAHQAFLDNQRALSGPCVVVYDRDAGIGEVPENLKNRVFATRLPEYRLKRRVARRKNLVGI